MSYRALLSNPINSLFDFIDIPESMWQASRKFDAVFQDAVSYPPFNLLQETENKFRIDVAVAGFKESELDVSKEGTNLFISGTPNHEESEPLQWIRRKLAKRSFKLAFTLGNDINIISAGLENGILSISLQKIVPEEKKPQKINIMLGKPEQINLLE